MRLPVCALALALASPAFAGGVGILGTAGAFTETVYFYDSSTDYTQYKQSQTLTDYGSGLEFVLGDRDDKITGMFRLYWLHDSPEKDPAELTGLVDPANVVANVREDPRNIGMASFGVQWGIIGSPDTFMVNALTSIGTGFITSDHTEFVSAQLGGGVTYRVARDAQLFGEVVYVPRYRKGLEHGASAFAGARWLFD